jgi:hypothetical protein
MTRIEAQAELQAWNAANPNADAAERVRVMRAIAECITDPTPVDMAATADVDAYLTSLRIGGAL